VFTYETANFEGEIEGKFSKSLPKSAKFWWFSGPSGQGLVKVSIFTAKGTSIRGSTSFETFCVKKSKESNKHHIFHIFTQKPLLLRSSPNLFWGLIYRT